MGENHPSSTTNNGSHPSSQSRSSGAPVTGGTTATMTVTSPAWSGTSWTGGMAYGCTAALKTTGDGGKLHQNLELINISVVMRYRPNRKTIMDTKINIHTFVVQLVSFHFISVSISIVLFMVISN